MRPGGPDLDDVQLARQSLIANVDVVGAGGEVVASERADGNRLSGSSAGRKSPRPFC